MSPMLILHLVLALQLVTGTASDRAVPQTYRITGKVIVGRDEPVRTDIVLKSLMGDPGRTVQSFANGTFRFDDVTLGNYSIEVTDSRFNLYYNTLLLRDPADTGKEVVVHLVRRGEPGTLSGPLDSDLYTIDATTLAKTPAKAMDEYNKGVDAIRNRNKANPADAHFRKAIAEAPQFYEAQLQLGIELKEQNNKDDAIQSFEKAAALKPAERRPLSLLGELYDEALKFQRAVDVLSRLAALGALEARDEYFLGVAHYRLDQMNPALDHLLAAINKGNDTDPAPFLQLHNVFVKMKDSRALAVLEDYLKLFPNDPNHAQMEERAKQMRTMMKRPG